MIKKSNIINVSSYVIVFRLVINPPCVKSPSNSSDKANLSSNSNMNVNSGLSSSMSYGYGYTS